MIYKGYPMISIALTTFNGENFLKEQIDSILTQTYTDIELIVCDDMSTDSTKEILLNYAENDCRCKVFFNDTNLGFMKNFEKAISLCTGNYIALSDQDDIWEPSKLATLLSKIDDYDFVCSDSLLVDENGFSQNITMKNVCNYHWIPRDTDSLFKRLLFTNIVQGSTMLARADFLKSCPSAPPEIKFHDYWFALHSCAKNGFYYYDDCTIRYRQHSSNITNNKKLEFKTELKKGVTSQEDYKKYCEFYEEKINQYKTLQNLIEFKPSQKKYISSIIRYYSELKDKSFYTFIFFALNCKYIYLDKNIFRNSIRITKRFLGFLYWKLVLRRRLFSSQDFHRE